MSEPDEIDRIIRSHMADIGHRRNNAEIDIAVAKLRAALLAAGFVIVPSTAALLQKGRDEVGELK